MADRASLRKSRRFHHKSRHGCLGCKQRKIKCDETKPICVNCAQRNLECSLREITPTASQLTTRTAVSDVSTPPLLGWISAQVALGLGPSFCRNGTRDLELYCHFHAQTAPSFARPMVQVFRDEYPKLAVSFPFVGHGLLAAGYLHCFKISPIASEELRREAAFHVSQAVPEYLAFLKDITKDNATALYEFACLVVLFSNVDITEENDVLLRTAKNISSRKPEALRRLTNNMIRTVQSNQNVLTVFGKCYRWIASGPLSPIFKRHNLPMRREPLSSWMVLEDGRLASLNRLWEDNPAVRSAESRILSNVLTSLRDTFSMVTQLTTLPSTGSTSNAHIPGADLAEIHRQLSAGSLDDMPSVFTWYIRLPSDFLAMVEHGNTYAMVILAHFAIVLDRACTGKWWSHRMPLQYVEMAELILGEERRAWIEWPLLVVKRRTPVLISQSSSLAISQPVGRPWGKT